MPLILSLTGTMAAQEVKRRVSGQFRITPQQARLVTCRACPATFSAVGTMLDSDHVSAKSLPKHAAAAVHDEKSEACDRCAVLKVGSVTWPCEDSTDPTMPFIEQGGDDFGG